MAGTIVLYPSPGMGHLISMVELGKLILTHHPSFKITILTLIPSFNTGSTPAYVRRISAAIPAITFHHLPDIPLDPELYPSMEAVIFELLRLGNSNVRDALHSISRSVSAPITAFIIDLFCSSAMPIATSLNIPVYYFFTSGACCLSMTLHLPVLHDKTTVSYKDMNSFVHSPGLPPIPSSDMSTPILDRTSTEYSCMLDYSGKLAKSAGIIVNTFESLENRALKAIADGLCTPADEPTPPIYCIGPLIAAGGDGSSECLDWLDRQPRKSVVYLCFGSLGLFSVEQLKEIAVGLEKSGQRFLWVVRSPPSNDKSKRFLRPPEPDLDVLLPEGFLGRTKERGLVVKSWAPQVAVLSHDSVGGFVTHCGWNSVLEAICAGVPMVAWPLYAEQRFNRVVLVEEMKLALPMKESESGWVEAAEVELRVRQLMESEEGRAVREVAEAKKEEARSAMGEGGSSRLALAKLVESW